MRQKEVHPNGDNTTLAELGVAIKAAPTRKSYERLNAIRALLPGFEREEVALMFAISDRQLRLWIHLFNRSGIDGLVTIGKPTGRRRKIRLKCLDDLLVPVLEEPHLAGEQHWTGCKVHGYLTEKLKVELGYSTVIRYLHDLNFVLRFPRPWATGPGKSEEAREAFREKLEALRERDDVRLWLGDETGIEGDPRPRRRWAQKGSSPKLTYHGGHLRRSVIGAVQPDSGEFFAMCFNACDTEVFQCYLDHLAETCPAVPGKQDLLVLDNASWHKVKSLRWHHFEALYLPAVLTSIP